MWPDNMRVIKFVGEGEYSNRDPDFDLAERRAGL
jgi:hypothetical protein